MKKIRGDKPIEVTVHTYMYSMYNTYSLCSYLYLKAKMSCFSCSLFSFVLLQNWRTERQKKSCLGWEWGREAGGRRREVMRKVGRTVNTYKKCVHV
jgi:hypothetical protein